DSVPPVVAPEAVAWFISRAGERPVIAAVAGILAPGHAGVDADRRQQGCRPRAAVGAPPQPPQAELALRSGPVTFALIGANTSSAQYYRDGEMPRDQHPAAAHPWPCGNPEKR